MTKDKGQRTNYKFWLLIGTLLFGGILINWFEQRGEASIERKPLSEIPAQLGEWKKVGEDIRFEEQTEAILRTSDYMMREYFSSKQGRIANVYVGYYASQRTGATYHSPQNCLPGAGWEMKRPQTIKITTSSGRTFEANHYIIENNKYKEVLIYWYQGRGRAVASEYDDKIYTVLDSILRQRSDGAMVRVMTGVGDSEAESTQAAIELSARLADNLSSYVPE